MLGTIVVLGLDDVYHVSDFGQQHIKVADDGFGDMVDEAEYQLFIRIHIHHEAFETPEDPAHVKDTSGRRAGRDGIIPLFTKHLGSFPQAR